MNRIMRVAGGFTLITAGVTMLVLPGPGVLTIIGGLALLSTEYKWAERAMDRAKSLVKQATNTSKKETPEEDQAGG